MRDMSHHSTRILIDESAIRDRVRELGVEISAQYPEGVVLVGILRGAFYFLADLSRAITSPVEIDFMAVSSYVGTESSGKVTLSKDLDSEIAGRDVLIIEDIVDTGRTLSALLAFLKDRNPRNLGICALIDKPSRRIVRVPVQYSAFTIADQFVVGYGLDYDQAYRNLPHIAVLHTQKRRPPKGSPRSPSKPRRFCY